MERHSPLQHRRQVCRGHRRRQGPKPLQDRRRVRLQLLGDLPGQALALPLRGHEAHDPGAPLQERQGRGPKLVPPPLIRLIPLAAGRPVVEPRLPRPRPVPPLLIVEDAALQHPRQERHGTLLLHQERAAQALRQGGRAAAVRRQTQGLGRPPSLLRLAQAVRDPMAVPAAHGVREGLHLVEHHESHAVEIVRVGDEQAGELLVDDHGHVVVPPAQRPVVLSAVAGARDDPQSQVRVGVLQVRHLVLDEGPGRERQERPAALEDGPEQGEFGDEGLPRRRGGDDEPVLPLEQAQLPHGPLLNGQQFGTVTPLEGLDDQA